MAVRTFFALDIDDALRQRLAEVSARVDCGRSKVNWVRPENLHVTMHFLGDVDDAKLAEVCRLAGEAAAGVEPFGFHVRGLSCIPPRGAVRMIWADAADPTGRMEALRNSLMSALAGLGFREESRRFKGHITLARVRFGRQVERIRRGVEAAAPAGLPGQFAEELVAYSSRLGPGGPTYEAIARAPLGA